MISQHPNSHTGMQHSPTTSSSLLLSLVGSGLRPSIELVLGLGHYGCIFSSSSSFSVHKLFLVGRYIYLYVYVRVCVCLSIHIK